MTSKKLELPRLVAGRDYADDMVDANLADVAGVSVEIDASRLMSGTSSFAAQLVERILVDGAASDLVLRQSPASFTEYVMQAARALNVTDRVDVTADLHTVPDEHLAAS